VSNSVVVDSGLPTNQRRQLAVKAKGAATHALWGRATTVIPGPAPT
jgi:hypothetical protein